MTRKLDPVPFPEPEKHTYTPEAFSGLCEEFQIPPELRDEVLRRLEDSAAVWRRYHRSEEPRPLAHHVRQELQKLAKHAASLAASYHALTDEARRALTMRQEHHAMHGALEALTAASPPYPYLHIPSADRDPVVIEAEPSDIARLVEGLGMIAEEASGRVSPQKAGTRRSEALRLWISNVQLIWTDLLGRPFTRDFLSNGEPVSEAARFCIAAFAPIDPKTPKTRVDNAMRQHIAKPQSET